MSHREPAPNLRRSLLRLKTRILLGPLFSEGARLLWAIASLRFKGRIAHLADAVPALDASTVHLHLHGDKRPENATRAAYFAAFGVPKAAWDRPPSEPFRLPALAAFTARALDALATAGDAGLEIGAIGKACKLASDPAEADYLAIAVVYLMRGDGLVVRPPGSLRWHLTRAGKVAARRAA
jgi:hypothetical protein